MTDKCGAKTKSGAPCQKWAMTNGKCRLHGGRTPKTNANGAKPGGLYSRFLTPGEQADFHVLKLGNLDDELRLMRIRLARALAAEALEADKPELETVVEREGGGMAFAKVERTFKRRDYVSVIDRVASRIESMERSRVILMADNGGAEELPTSDGLTLGEADEPGPP